MSTHNNKKKNHPFVNLVCSQKMKESKGEQPHHHITKRYKNSHLQSKCDASWSFLIHCRSEDKTLMIIT
jgi:hypothetical protein